MGMVKVTGFRSWNLNADNLDDTLTFYRDVLGAEEAQTQEIQGAKVVRLRVGGASVGLFDAGGGPRPGVPHHTFAVEGRDDPEAFRKELESKGYRVDGIRPHSGGNGYSLYVFDPSGNRIELSVGDG